METELATARMALRQMIDAAASGPMGPETTNDVLIGRTVAGRAAIRAVEAAMEVAGGAGFFRELGPRAALPRRAGRPLSPGSRQGAAPRTRGAWPSVWT